MAEGLTAPRPPESTGGVGESDLVRKNTHAFRELCPHCRRLASAVLTATPDMAEMSAAVSELAGGLTWTSMRYPSEMGPAIGTYVFYPLGHIFRNHHGASDQIIACALRCLETLLRTCWRLEMSSVQARETLKMLAHLLMRNYGVSPTGAAQEQAKLAAAKCVVALCESVDRIGGDLFSDPEGIRSVTHSFNSLVVVASSAEGNELRVGVVRALKDVVFTCVRSPDVLASYYPGITSSLLKCISAWSAQRDRCLEGMALAIELVGALVREVLGDHKTAEIPPLERCVDNQIAVLVNIKRCQNWLRATAAKTKYLVECILRYRTYYDLRVRRAIYELCRDLLDQCSSTLDQLVPQLVQTMMIFSGDRDNDFRALAESTLRVMTVTSQPVAENINANLYSWAASLPRAMTSDDTDIQAKIITRLSLGFKMSMAIGLDSSVLGDLLAQSIRDSLLSAADRESVTRAVQDEPFSFDTLLAIDKTTALVGPRRIARFPDVVLGHQSQRETLSAMKELMCALGSSPKDGLLLAQGYIRASSRVGTPARGRATSLWVGLQLLEGALERSAEMYEFLDPEFVPEGPLLLQVAGEVLVAGLSVVTNAATLAGGVGDDVANPTLQCLALESIAVAAHVRRTSFRGDLVEALYPIVHLLGSSSGIVQSHAITTLNSLAHSCGYASAKDLILGNVDYMVNEVALKFSSFDLSPQAPVVLGMMVKLAGASLVPYLDDLVASIFTALNEFHGYESLSESLWAVLGQIVEESAKSGEFLAITGSGGQPHSQGGALLTAEELVKKIREDLRYEEEKAAAVVDVLGEYDPAAHGGLPQEPWGTEGKGKAVEGEDEPPADEQVEAPTKAYELIHRIALLSQNFITHESIALRLKMLNLVKNASPLLASNEPKFLPLVNDLWPGVVDRLSEDHPAIVVSAADGISQLAQSCGDFLSSRIADAWPGIKRVFLQAQARLDRERQGRSPYIGVYSPAYKVWHALCRMIVNIVENTRPDDDLVDEVCRMFGAPGLLERSDVRTAVEMVNAEAVWLELVSRGNDGGDGTRWDTPLLEGVKFYDVVF